jgi:hypothetical protein
VTRGGRYASERKKGRALLAQIIGNGRCTLASSGRNGTGRLALFGQVPNPWCGICSSFDSVDIERIFVAIRAASPFPAGPAHPSGRAVSGVRDVQRTKVQQTGRKLKR